MPDASAQTGPVDVAWGAVLRKPIGARARRRGGQLAVWLLLSHEFLLHKPEQIFFEGQKSAQKLDLETPKK